MDRAVTCCFSGHRPMRLPWGQNERDPRCIELKLELAARLEGIYALGYRRFLCGMALGCDMYFAEAVLAMRSVHPDVRLEAVVPCASQSDRWTRPQRARYEALLAECDGVTVLQQDYTPDCMQRRNRRMVDSSSLLLCCYGGRPGGTMSTILYAERSGLEVVIIELDEVRDAADDEYE